MSYVYETYKSNFTVSNKILFKLLSCDSVRSILMTSTFGFSTIGTTHDENYSLALRTKWYLIQSLKLADKQQHIDGGRHMQ